MDNSLYPQAEANLDFVPTLLEILSTKQCFNIAIHRDKIFLWMVLFWWSCSGPNRYRNRRTQSLSGTNSISLEIPVRWSMISTRPIFLSNHTPQSIGRKLTTLRERTVRIHSETHPTRFSVPRFPVRFVGLPPENRIFQKSKIRNFFRTKSADLGS